MRHYRYDGTFAGYMTAVYIAWHDGLKNVVAITPSDGEADLFHSLVPVRTDTNKVKKIVEALEQQCGQHTMHILYYAFMSELPDREMKLLDFLQQAFYWKADFLNHRKDPEIWEICDWCRKVSNERQKLLGLMRFGELENGMLYAMIKPSANVVPLVAAHFADRLRNENWVIHDVKRGIGAYYDGKQIVLVEIVKSQVPTYGKDELEFRRLWQEYYRHIGIKERKNNQLRQSFMPKKYWQYLVELETP